MNEKQIIVADGITKIPDEAFLDHQTLEEIILPDSVKIIGKAAFKGCTSLKKIKLPSNVQWLDEFAFSECESLEEITIPSSLSSFSCGVFSHCHHLKTIHGYENIEYIDDFAFYDCKKLQEFQIPENVFCIGRKAFFGCESIKEIHIPKKVDCISVGAFAKMSSLEKITVDPENQKYFTEEEIALLSKDGLFLQYAIHCPYKEYTIGYYMIDFGTIKDEFGNKSDLQSPQLPYRLADYAFAGAKHLEKIEIPSELESIGGNTFSSCASLNTLEIFHTDYGDTFSLQVFPEYQRKNEIPFKQIFIEDGIKTLCSNLEDLFENVETIRLPNTLTEIGNHVFTKSKNLKNIHLPSSLNTILPNAFYPETNLFFPTYGTIKAKELLTLQTKTKEIEEDQKKSIQVLSLTNGNYSLNYEDYDTINITNEEIKKISKTNEQDPETFVLYLIDLLKMNAESSRILTHIWLDPNLKKIFRKFAEESDYVFHIAHHKISKIVKEILDAGGHFDEFLFSNILINQFSKKDIEKIVTHYNPSIARFFKYGKNIQNIHVDKLLSYCDLLEQYQKYDPFFYQPIFFQKVDYKYQELFIKYFNNNIKNLLKNSHVLDDTYGENLKDLLYTCHAFGVFHDNPIISQKMTTFLNEKLLNKQTGIYGHKIHTIFGELIPRDTVDEEFLLFFVENYQKLLDFEKNKSGFLVDVYNSFREISKTSTSHRGSQRHLKVTFQKCLEYFLVKTFDNICKENKELAYFLQKYYTETYALSIAEEIVKQSQKAPRNIFTKVAFDQEGNPIYCYDPTKDLEEKNTNTFSYRWLPKQDYHNLILGKYCHCCAHILGAGAGIMRASMISDNCQNLVIENQNKEIIAKMTIYVNKDKGYAVFNTAEININYHEEKDRKQIYLAFMRGTRAFLKKYNENHTIPITTVSIGGYRNMLKDYLNNIHTDVFPTPNYSTYGYYVNEKKIGTYNGDCKEEQLLVLKKEI